MKYDLDEMIDRTQSISIKWDPAQRKRMYGETDILPMGIADMECRSEAGSTPDLRIRLRCRGIPPVLCWMAKAPQWLGYSAGLDPLHAWSQYGTGLRS